MRILFKLCLMWICLSPSGVSRAAADLTTDEMVERVLGRYATTPGFEANVEIYEQPGSSLCDAEGKCIEPFETQRGTISFEKPFRLRVETSFERQYPGEGSISREKIFITDGTISWEESIVNLHNLEPGARLLVERNRVSLAGWDDESAQVTRPAGITDGLPADPEARRLELSLRASGLVARPTRPFRAAPAYLLAPFRGIARDRITYSGAALLSGVPCHLFEIQDSLNQRTGGSGLARHWIGRDDGVVRKIEEMAADGVAMRRRIELTDVIIRASFDRRRFVLEDDVQYEIEDSEERLASARSPTIW